MGPVGQDPRQALMDLTLTEDQTMVQRTAREFLAGREGQDVWKEITDLGWQALPFEDFGFLEACLIVEELGRARVTVPYVSTVACAGFAAPALRTRIAGGEVFAYAPFSGALVPWAAEAAELLVATPSGVVLTSEVDRTPVSVVGPAPTCRVTYDSVTGTSLAAATDTIEAYGAAATCAEMVGGAQAVLDKTVEYAKEREQFGKPIGAFQAVQHHCANMAIDVMGARFIAYEAIWRLSRGLDASVEVSVAKSWVSEAYERVCALGHQVHGAIGFTEEHDLHHYTRHAMSSALAFGDADTHIDRLATHLGI
ncbi:MAG: acyl-CoA dehydrogenase family protein [Actinophytocola sp.]|uniref:acyl-CoA dehydrogenase family protein n=1 Tax=Actinophytocola sp. TaxID=1872138 RepID=UPI003C738AF1